MDRVLIVAKAGRGGDGCVSFRHEAFRPKGGPDGGDGGDGGSVILEATTHRASLQHLTSQVHYKAKSGEQGRGRHQTGKRGASLTVEVPPGTLVYALAEGETRPPEGAVPLVDMIEPGQRFVLARGGKAGRGNTSFATSINQAPREATQGEPGQEGRFAFELKLIAEVGIVGLPNAGKSTFISRVSAARPKIANYPFTTVVPNLGVATLGDRQVVLADIPGLIEGASQGKGLGDDFLRHVERTRALLHLIDATGEELGGLAPVDAYRTIRAELASYKRANLEGRPELVALNKVDSLDPAEATRRARVLSDSIGRPVLQLSAVSGAGCQEVLEALARLLDDLDAPDAPQGLL
ncbi:MAG: GTPase ObgE [Planctomycetota bacterium]